MTFLNYSRRFRIEKSCSTPVAIAAPMASVIVSAGGTRMPPRNSGLSSWPARAPCKRLAAAASTLPLLLTLLALLTSFAVNTPGISVHTHRQKSLSAHPASLYTHRDRSPCQRTRHLCTHTQTEVAVNTPGISVHTHTDRSRCQQTQHLCTQTHTCTCCCQHIQYCYKYTCVACHGKLTSQQEL